MRILYLLLTILIALNFSCTKADDNLSTTVATTNRNPPTPTGLSTDRNPSTPTALSIYNPIVGKWELGCFKILCLGAKDTTIYPNERGDFVEFRKTDTAFYTFNTTNATGWSPYKILDSARFVLGDTMRIISY